jgi:RimJ/RimL family protein N-acetyltransferase
MLKGDTVTLRAIERGDLQAMWAWNNDLETEVLGGGDPPMPQSMASVQAGWEAEANKGERGTEFAIEADGKLVGMCALHRFDQVARVCEVGIVIGEEANRGKGYGRDALRTVVA